MFKRFTIINLLTAMIIVGIILIVVAVNVANDNVIDLAVGVLNTSEKLTWANVMVENVADVKAEVWKRMQDQINFPDRVIDQLKREHDDPLSHPAVWSRK